MPELPDLQVFARNLDKQLSGKTLAEISVKNDRKLKVSKAALKHALEGQKLESVYRAGKELHFKFRDHILGLHLMLNGKLHISDQSTDHKHTIMELLFDDDTCLTLTDYQAMAVATLDPGGKNAPDALSKEAGFSFLKAKFARSRSAVKKLLLDQNVIQGIGNAYADEILWEAGLSPFSVSNKIPDEKIKALASAIRSVLKEAEKQIVKEHPDIISGEYRDFLKIHNSKKAKSPTGATIRNEMLNSRKTYYTDEQELYT